MSAPVRTMAAVVALLAALCAPRARADGPAVASPTAAEAAPTPTASVDAGRIREIRIRADDVFDLDAGSNLAFRAANAVHIVTRPWIVRRMLLFREGDVLDPEALAETERNLRAADPFRAASVTATPRPDGTYNVEVRTRDRWSTRIGAGIGHAGGVSEARFDLGDANLLGLGVDASFAFAASSIRKVARAGYRDPDLWGSRIQLSLSGATGDHTREVAAALGSPFYGRETPAAWSAGVATGREDIDYVRDGEVVATVRHDFDRVGASGGVGFGPRDCVKRLELTLDVDRSLYDAPTGSDPFAARWPRDRDVVNVVLRPSIDLLSRFERLERLDAARIVEDVPFGWRLAAAAGVQRREDSRGVRAEALGGLLGTWSLEPLEGDVLALHGAFTGRHDGSRTQAWGAQGFLRYYARVPFQTFALNVDAAAAEEREDLDVQLTLGEDNGLRGYPAREFAGTRRVRANLEDRIFTPVSLWTFYLGFVVFADAGLVWDESHAPGLDDVRTSLGVGVRVSSAEVLKQRALRVDLAFPLQAGDWPGFSVSFSVGQVFALFEGEDAGLSF